MNTYTLQVHARDVQLDILGDIGRHTGYDLIERDETGTIISIQSLDLKVSGPLGFQKIGFDALDSKLYAQLSNGQYWPTKIIIDNEERVVNDDLAAEYKFKTATIGEGASFKKMFEKMKFVASICNQLASIEGGLINYGPLNGPNCNTFTNYFNSKYIQNSQLWDMLSYDGTSEFVGSDENLFECCAAEDKNNLIKMDYLIDQFVSQVESAWNFDYSNSFCNVQNSDYGWTLNIGNEVTNYIFDDDGRCEIVDGDRSTTIYAGDGLNIINAGGGDNTVYGGKDEDRISCGDGIDFIEGKNGSDVIYGGGGQDRIFGGEGDDEIHGGDGDDWIYGDTDIFGNTTIVGNDTIWGGDGNDNIWGGAGNDTIYAGTGINYIDGGAGINHIHLEKTNEFNQVFLNNTDGGIDYIYNYGIQTQIKWRNDLVLESYQQIGSDGIYTFTNGSKAIIVDAYDSNGAIKPFDISNADLLIQAMSTFSADNSHGLELSNNPTENVSEMYNLAANSGITQKAI